MFLFCNLLLLQASLPNLSRELHQTEGIRCFLFLGIYIIGPPSKREDQQMNEAVFTRAQPFTFNFWLWLYGSDSKAYRLTS